jgi:hypothetical protein
MFKALKRAVYVIPGVEQTISALINLAPTIAIFAVIAIAVLFL